MQSLHNQTAAAVSETPSTRNVAPNGVVELSNFELLTLLLSLVAVIVVSQLLQMNIEKQLTIASIRCFIQLSALGLILVPIIMWNKPVLVLSYIVFMMFVAAVEASSRPPYIFDSILLVCFIAISGTVAVFGTFTFSVVLRTGLEAQYAIPIIGMITGTSLSAVSVAVSNVVTSVAERKESIELLLAFGATRWEAGLDCIRSSVILGLTPTLNLLSVTGLVSIPGMMTGQVSAAILRMFPPATYPGDHSRCLRETPRRQVLRVLVSICTNLLRFLLLPYVVLTDTVQPTTIYDFQNSCFSDDPKIIGGTPPSLAAKYQLVIMYVAAGTATIATVLASILTLYVLTDSQHRIRSEKLMPRESVNRLDAIITSAKYLATNFLSWRGRVARQDSPFPSYVQDPLPGPTNPADPLTKTERNFGSGYGATSREKEEKAIDS